MTMQYREYLPHPALRPVVECYWSVQGKFDGSYTIYPDACMDIIYDFGSLEAVVVGNMFTPIQQTLDGVADMFGIRFHAAGIGRLLRVPLADFNDTSLPLREFYKVAPEAGQLRALSMQDRVNMIDRWMLKAIIFSSKPEAWEFCLNKIAERSGNVNVYDLSREAGISQKQLERKFIEKVGPTPKQFAQLLKFRKLKARLNENSFDLITEFNFTDHAHLTKFFKKFALITPTEYLSNLYKDPAAASVNL